MADADLDALPAVAAEFPQWQHIAVQAAIDGIASRGATRGQVLGVPVQGLRPPTLAELLVAPDVRFGPIEYVSLAVGVGETRPCIARGLLLGELPEGRLIAWVRLLQDQAQLSVEVKAHSLDVANAFLAELRRGMVEHNPYRGHSLRVHLDNAGAITSISFHPRPHVERDDLVLPPGVLDAIDAHAVGIGHVADRLRAAGRHVKRGLLLHGPPGTGKTHTVRYIASQLPEATLLILTGSDMLNLKAITGLLPEMAPVVVVLDDVDLVAEDRRSADNAGASLFDLLDAMDGMREDVDVLFVCTSNRANSLEEAISSRPGRIDQAIEIPPPDAASRRRLIDVYAQRLDLQLEDVDAVVRRTQGVTASFIKELLRRATVMAMADDDDADDADDAGVAPPAVRDHHVHSAIDELLDPSHPLYRALLGVHEAPDRAGASAEQHGVRSARSDA